MALQRGESDGIQDISRHIYETLEYAEKTFKDLPRYLHDIKVNFMELSEIVGMKSGLRMLRVMRVHKKFYLTEMRVKIELLKMI